MIIKAVKAEVKKRKLSQSEFGKMCSTTRTHVNNIFRKKEPVGFKKLLRMANSLNLRVDIKMKRVR